ncbi:MAG: hypothetical protein M3R55_06675, partial [Acidobacteriota bacterium]|nr:hypothetical protein [Acidobacteriota bacterium]
MRRPLLPHSLLLLAVLAGAPLACRDSAPPPAPDTTAGAAPPPSAVPAVPAATDGRLKELPRKLGSLRFAVIGDTGRGDRHQY